MSRHKAFLLPINVDILIVTFDDIKQDIEVGWENQYYLLYSFGSFVLSPGHTL